MTKEIKILLLTFVALVGGIIYLEVQKREGKKEIEPFEKEVKLVDPEPIEVVVKDPEPPKPKPEPIKIEPPKPTPKPVVVKPKPVPKPVEVKSEPKIVDVKPKPTPKPIVTTKPVEKPKENKNNPGSNPDVAKAGLDPSKPINVVVNTVIPKIYTIQKGDILSQIAEKQLGSIYFVPDILEANPELIPDLLLVGVELVMPKRELLLRKADSLNKKRFNVSGGYEIKKGDNLYSISMKQLGSGNRVNEILKLNPGLNPQSLRIGDKIKLPK